MLDVDGTELSQEDRERLLHPLVGAVILFARNYENPQALEAMTQSIHALRAEPLLIAVDHEGGRVQRFRAGFTGLPAAARTGVLYDRDSTAGLAAAHAIGLVMAAELRRHGVDFSFAPVLDLDAGVSAVIGDRAFHRLPEVAVALARACLQGMRAGGMAATGKHFPGHGAVALDSHLALPVDDRSEADIRAQDLVPFAALASELQGVMPAHVVYSACDALPAGFSRFWIQTVLRDELGFAGAVFSDDLSMAGAAVLGGMRERAEAAWEAGCDMVLVCNDRAAANLLLDEWRPRPDPARARRVAGMRGPALPPVGLTSRAYRDALAALARVP